MQRKICLFFLILFTNHAFADYEKDFKARSGIIISKIADQYTPPSKDIGDPEKYYFPKAIARIEKYGNTDSVANAYISLFKNNSPFHFTLVGMARIMSLYKDAPAMQASRKTYLEKVWARTDSYNAWTAEGTENHVNMSRTSGYLFAMHAKEFPEFKDAEAKQNEMKEWILRWSKTIFSVGTAEWNSSIYEAHNMVGWLNLYDFAQDPEVKAAAKAVLDYYAAELALNYFQGALGGSEMRGGGVSGEPASSAESMAWLWYGDVNFDMNKRQVWNSDFLTCLHAVTSSYRPPIEAVLLATKKDIKNEVYRNSKPSYLYETPSYIKQYMYIDNDFSLGSAFVPYGGYVGSSFQVVAWKLVTRTHQRATPFIVTGNGRYYNELNGKTRDPYTQLVQHKNVLIQMSRLPVNHKDIEKEIAALVKKWSDDWKKDFKSRFPNDQYKMEHSVIKMPPAIKRTNSSYIQFPKAAERRIENNVICLRLEDVYVALTSLNKSIKVQEVTSNNPKNSEKGVDPEKEIVIDSTAAGKICGFVLELSTKEDVGSFDNFCNLIKFKKGLDTSGLDAKNTLSYQSLKGDVIEAEYITKGKFTEAIVDWGIGVHKPMLFHTAPPLKQPKWPEGEGYGRIAKWKVNGIPVDLDTKWAVYEGLRYTLDHGNFELRSPESFYRINYSGPAIK